MAVKFTGGRATPLGDKMASREFQQAKARRVRDEIAKARASIEVARSVLTEYFSTSESGPYTQQVQAKLLDALNTLAQADQATTRLR